MALTFATGMTLIDGANATTNWAAYKITAGGGTPTVLADTTLQRQSTGCLGITPTASKDCGIIFNYYAANGNTPLNMATTGNEILAVWVLGLSPAVLDTQANGGMYLIVECDNALPSTTGKWAKWYVSGGNVYKGGWTLFLVDTRKTPSATNGGWTSTDLQTVYRVGAGTLATATSFRTDSFYVDAAWYGRPSYRVTGDGATTATWADFLAHAVFNENGLIADVGGVYQLSCGIQFGNTSQSATTTFADATGQQLLWKRHTYYQGGGVVDAMTYSDVYQIKAVGAASYKTSVTCGSVVGSGDTRRGILGGSFRNPTPASITVSVDFRTGAANLSAAKFYGVDFVGINGGMSFEDDSGGTMCSLISGTVVNCAEVSLGSTYIGEMLAALIVGATTQGLTVDSVAEMARAKFCSFINCNYGIKITAASASYGCNGHTFTGNTYDIENSSGGAVTITPSNNSNVSSHHETGGGSTTISNDKTLTLTGLVSGSDIVILTAGTSTERVNVDANSGSTYDFQYPYTADDYVDICVYKQGYVPFAIRSFLLPSTGGSVPIAQVVDRNFSDPA